MTEQQLQAIGQRLVTQDNRITANPIFVVQRRVREYGFEPKWAEGTAWIDGQGEEITADTEDATETGYRDRWEFVQPFFTEEAADRYIAANKHNLGTARVYVASGYRNDEWALVRELLTSLKQGPPKGILRDLPEGPGPWVALLVPAASWPELDNLAEKAWNDDVEASSELGGRLIAMMDKNRQYGRLPPAREFQAGKR